MKRVPDIPPNIPRLGNGLTRWIGRMILMIVGWRVVGTVPNEPKIMVAGAPHTSNMDFILAMGTLLALGLKMSYLMKKEAFFFPFKGLFMWLGGIPTDRGKSANIVEQAAEYYQTHDTVWVGITPEGTRSKVKKWKTGFARIAHAANVPILLVGIDAENKHIVLEQVLEPRADYEAFAEELRQYFHKTYQGVKPQNQ